MKQAYNAWPLGSLRKDFQRVELDLLKEAGYDYGDDAREIVNMFEQKVAKFAGSKYAVAVDSCTNALFLSLEYTKQKFKRFSDQKITITIPKQTYISVPQSIIHAGYDVNFADIKWEGAYKLEPLDVYDGAVRFTKGMYIKGSLHCLSFQIKKVLPIGKGGMILTDDEDAYKWLLKARYEGRDITKKYDEDELEFIGWNMYMYPEESARGILLMDKLPEVNKDMADYRNYPDLSKQKVFNKGK